MTTFSKEKSNFPTLIRYVRILKYSNAQCLLDKLRIILGDISIVFWKISLIVSCYLYEKHSAKFIHFSSRIRHELRQTMLI